MRSVPHASGVVFGTVLQAAEQLGYQVAMEDRDHRQVFLTVPHGGRRPPERFAVSVTDSGYGTATLHMSWDARVVMDWPARSSGRSSRHLYRTVNRMLGTRSD